jgi:hypothetical protein
LRCFPGGPGFFDPLRLPVFLLDFGAFRPPGSVHEFGFAMVPVVGDHMVYDHARYQAGDGPDGGPKASSRMAWPAAAPATVATPMVAASLKPVRLEVGGSETGDRETEQPELRQSPAARSVRMMDFMVIKIMRPQLGERWRESERRRRREDSFREDPYGRIASDFFSTHDRLHRDGIFLVRGDHRVCARRDVIPAQVGDGPGLYVLHHDKVREFPGTGFEIANQGHRFLGETGVLGGESRILEVILPEEKLERGVSKQRGEVHGLGGQGAGAAFPKGAIGVVDKIGCALFLLSTPASSNTTYFLRTPPWLIS